MEKILFIGLVLVSLLGAGAVGTMMTGQNIGMMQSNYRGMRSWGCPMLNDREWDERMQDYCRGLTFEECGEMHEECEEYMHKYCEHDDTTIRDSRGRWHGCPMMR